MPKEQPFTADTMKKMKESAPKFIELNSEVLFGDIWSVLVFLSATVA